MANYPGSIFSPRAVADRAGVVYNALKTKVFYAKDHNDFGNEIKAIEETLGIDFNKTFRQVSKEGLVLAMNLNSESIDGTAGSEKVLDSSGHNNHGVNSGATHDPDGGFNGGGAFDFDGADDYIDCGNGNSLDISDVITISVWVRVDGTGVGNYPSICVQSPASAEYGYLLFVGTSSKKIGGSFCSTSPDDINSDADAFSFGEWFHVVMTATKNGDIKLYKNGVLIKSSTAGNTVFSFSNPLLGKLRTNFFDGVIDELRIYNRVLSADEIRNLYMARKEIHNSFVSQKDIYVDSDGKPAIQNDILNIKTAKTPATAGASGVAGDICWDADYIYVCVAADTWKRVAISTW